MAYTPINWQTGDTITAAKLNKMDNGWSVESTPLFSETVTATEQSGMYGATLAYSGTINADTITVTFDGTEYICSRIDVFGSYYYGGVSESGPDFTNYPFFIESSPRGNNLYTQTAGTYMVSVAGPELQISDSFKTAVKSLLPPIVYVENGVTTWQEVTDAISGGKVVIANGNGKSLLVSSTEITSHGDYYCYAVGADSSGVVRVNSSSAASADSPVTFAS